MGGKGLTSSTVDIFTADEKEKEATEDSVKNDNFLSKCSDDFKNSTNQFRKKYKKEIRTFIYLLINVGFIVYFAFATKYFIDKDLGYLPFCSDDEYGLLILLVAFIYLIVINSLVLKPYFWPKVSKICNPIFNAKCFQTIWLNIIFYSIVLIGILAFLIYDSWESPNRLLALVGYSLLLFLGFLMSEYPGHIKWRPVLMGIVVQFCLGLFTIRWEPGRNIFNCTGHKVATFLNYTTVGASFVYGDYLIDNKVFAFQSLSVIFFLSFFVKILYFYGIIQKVVLNLGLVLQTVMGTTICESVNSAANIFLGMTEAPILLQPYLQYLTNSELFAVMTAGFASVSGTVLAAYIAYGAKAEYLLTASVMAAPTALCYSKLVYPETEESVSTAENIIIPEPEETSVLDAASKGASQAINIVLGISANVVAFVTFIAFLNGVISWLGVLVGFDNWSVEEGISYVFMPLSFLMGVPWEECKHVGKLIGIKTVINEFFAYKELGVMVKGGLLSPRSEVIATYAVCGFSNPGSVGIMLSTLGTLIPNKREAITTLIYKSFVAGAFVCFMTASIAGILVSPDQFK